MTKRTNSQQRGSNSKTRNLQFWVSIAAVAGAILALFALIPPFFDFITKLGGEIRDPRQNLIIEQAALSPFISEGTWEILSSSTDPAKIRASSRDMNSIASPCLDSNAERCQVSLYNELVGSAYNYRQEFDLKVSSISQGSPIVIEGLLVTLVGFKELGGQPLNVLYTPPQGGGGSGWSVYTLDKFPISGKDSTGIPLSLQTKDPTQAIGTSATATLDCSLESDCDKVLSLQPNEVEGLRLVMSFLKSLPAGWYEFDVAVRFSFRGQDYTSSAKQRFDIVKPRTIQPWFVASFEPAPLRSSFATVDLSNGVVDSSKFTSPLPDVLGHLVFKSMAALDKSYYVWNLHTGDLSHVGSFGSMVDAVNFEGRSPDVSSQDGWLWAVETFEWLPVRNIDLGIVDIKNLNFFRMQHTPSMREMQPTYSPSARYIAYVAYALQDTGDLRVGECDIYLYDMKEHGTRRLTFTPTIIKATPIWISDTELAFVMPEFAVIGNDRHTNTRVGIEGVNIETGETWIISNHRMGYYTIYLSSSKMILTNSTDGWEMLNLDGSVAGGMHNHSGYYCSVLDTISPKQLCSNEKVIGIFDELTGQFTKLADVEFDERFGATAILGSVAPKGFVIADLKDKELDQYSEDGRLVRVWTIPEMPQVFAWGVENLTYIPNTSVP